jgi:hypothetical protein
LRSQFPTLKLVAAILTGRDVEEIKNRKPAIPADELATSLKQAFTAICSLAQTSTPHSEEAVLAAR